MTETVGIHAFGAYIPRLRLQRAAVVAANAWVAPGLKGLGKGERAMAGWDEDVVTMAVEAARDCLTGVDRDTLGAVMLASTTAPFADRQNAGIVKEALNLGDEIATLDLGGSQRAGMSALLQALRGAGATLCVASERRAARPASEGELLYGDAAAALLVGPGAGVARLLATHSVSADFVAHFREAGRDFDYGWEARWVRDEGYATLVPPAIAKVLAKAGVEASAVDGFLLPATARGLGAAMAKAAGIPATAVRDTLGTTVGEAGAAHPILMLAHALESAKAGERLLVIGFGNGCDIALFEATGAKIAARQGVSGSLERRRPEENYLKYLTFAGHLQIEKGMRAEFDQKQPLTALWRHRRAVLGLVGARSVETGTVQYPPSEIPVDGQAEMPVAQEPYPLADTLATILTHTADSLTYTPDPPAYYGMIDFEGGGRMNVEFCDVEAGDVEVGRRVRMMFRIKAVDEQRGFVRYFWKAAPAPNSSTELEQ